MTTKKKKDETEKDDWTVVSKTGDLELREPGWITRARERYEKQYGRDEIKKIADSVGVDPDHVMLCWHILEELRGNAR